MEYKFLKREPESWKKKFKEDWQWDWEPDGRSPYHDIFEQKGTQKEDEQSGPSGSNILDQFLGGDDMSWVDQMGPESGGGDGGAESTAGAMEGGGGGEGGGFNWGPLGYFAAAVVAQHLFSGDTNREFEGQETSDLFQGSVGTEPWYAWAKQQMGLDDPSAGESFDAALKNEDWEKAIARFPSTLHYWFNPAQSSGYEAIKEQWGDEWALAIFPAEGVFGDPDRHEQGTNWWSEHFSTSMP